MIRKKSQDTERNTEQPGEQPEEGEVFVTQQSANKSEKASDGKYEELVDYGEDPMLVEKTEMNRIDKTFEEKADRLIKSMAVYFQTEFESL